MVNPLTRCVEEYALPPYEELRVTDIAPAVRAAIDELVLDLNSIEDDLASVELDEMSWEFVMDRLEIIDDPLDRLWEVVNHLCSAVNAPKLRAARANLQAEVLIVQSRRKQSCEIYRAMIALRDGEEWQTYSDERQRVLNRSILAATLNGANLEDNERDHFTSIHLRLKELVSPAYSSGNNVLDATKSYNFIATEKHQVEGLSPSILALLAKNAVDAGHSQATALDGPWKLSLEGPVYQPAIKNCKNRSVREALYRANVTRGSRAPFDNRPVIQEILELRQKRAKLLGYSSFAQLSLADKMAPSIDAVEEMISNLREQCIPLAEDEMKRLEEYAIAHGQHEGLEPWDIPYWAEQLRKDEYELDDEIIKSYFPMDRVLEGLFQVANSLFGVKVETADGMEQVWHPDVKYFQIRAMEEPGEPVIAQFYLDPYTRPGEKRHGSWMNVIVSRSRILRSEKAPVRLPVFNIVCNQTPPIENQPTLMTFKEVESLFRRFGYGLQLAFTKAEHTFASGMDGIEWDALEVSSKVFANFCYHSDSIRRISHHVDTGDSLPRALLERILADRKFMAGTTLLRQLMYSSVDMMLHHDYDALSPDTIEDIEAIAAQRFSVLPPVLEDRHLCYFNHIFEGFYGAGYYSYKWSEMMSADAYEYFEEAKDQETWKAIGRQFRDTILRFGGIHDPLTTFKLFRGRQPNSNALAKLYGLK